VNRISAMLLRPGSQSRADARGLLRAEARALLPRLAAATRRAGLGAEARAHLVEASTTLGQALAAPLLRTGI
jgi:hypothetical protein